jgi:hypothetical protein
VRPPLLWRAVAASAAVHLIIVAGLVMLARPRAPAAPAMRVALVDSSGPTGGPAASAGTGAGHEAPGRGTVGLAERPDSLERSGTAAGPLAAPAAGPRATDGEPARATPSRPASRPVRKAEARGTPVEGSGAVAAEHAVALLTPVQSDLWVLGGGDTKAGPEERSAPATADGTGAPGASSPEGGSPAAAASAGGPGAGAGSPSGSGAGGTGGPSLLALLSQRLAWSAQRCAPPSVVRTAGHAVPGVPLRFCLDAAGRPSEVGLLGTTGSEQLDRAARDCVIPGALPLPPVPGCYTVEVRFPTRG